MNIPYLFCLLYLRPVYLALRSLDFPTQPGFFFHSFTLLSQALYSYFRYSSPSLLHWINPRYPLSVTEGGFGNFFAGKGIRRVKGLEWKLGLFSLHAATSCNVIIRVPPSSEDEIPGVSRTF